MSKILIDKVVLEQALEALELGYDSAKAEAAIRKDEGGNT